MKTNTNHSSFGPFLAQCERLIRVAQSWRTVGDAAAREQPYRDALAATLAENPRLRELVQRR